MEATTTDPAAITAEVFETPPSTDLTLAQVEAILAFDPGELSLFEQADRVRWLRELADVLKSVKTPAEELLKQAKVDLATIMAIEEVDGFKRGGKTFFPTTDFFASVRKEDKPAVLAWLKANGHPHMVKEDVNAASLKGLVKEFVDNDEEGRLPEGLDGIVQTYTVPTVGMRKA